jgi:hypothetical protein
VAGRVPPAWRARPCQERRSETHSSPGARLLGAAAGGSWPRALGAPTPGSSPDSRLQCRSFMPRGPASETSLSCSCLCVRAAEAEVSRRRFEPRQSAPMERPRHPGPIEGRCCFLTTGSVSSSQPPGDQATPASSDSGAWRDCRYPTRARAIWGAGAHGAARDALVSPVPLGRRPGAKRRGLTSQAGPGVSTRS